MLLSAAQPACRKSPPAPLAIGVAQIAGRLSRADRQGATVDAMALKTLYIKASAAEDKANKT